MDENDPHELAGQLEGEAKDLERRSDELEQEIDDARQDWQRKQEDKDVPGAMSSDDAPVEAVPGAEASVDERDDAPGSEQREPADQPG